MVSDRFYKKQRQVLPSLSPLSLLRTPTPTAPTSSERRRRVVSLVPFQQRPRVPHDRPSDGVNPVFFLLVRISDEKHRLVRRRELEGVGAVDGILCSLDGQATVDVDDAAGGGVLFVERERERESGGG